MEQAVSFNFSQGVNNKSDPWQLQFGQFQSLQNSIFQKGGLLQKRNGYGLLTEQTPASSYLTTLNGSLLSIGGTVNAYSPSTASWVSHGTLQPCALSVLPVVRNNLNQVQCDSVIANGFILTTYTQTTSTTSAIVNEYLFSIADAETGQNIIQPTAIPSLATGAINGSSRVFVVGPFFVIVSPTAISGTTFLQYVSIPISNPSAISAPQNVHSEAFVPVTSNPSWDGVVSQDTLVVAYNTTAGGQGVHIVSLTQSQIAANSASAVVHAFTNAAYIASIVSVCVDQTANPNIFYISFFNSATADAYTCAVFVGFGTITTQFAPQVISSTNVLANIASVAQNGSAQIFLEVVNAYSYDSSIPTNYVESVPVDNAGTVGAIYTAIRSVGLASKGFIVSGKAYFLAAFQSPFQPSYFLINGTDSIQSVPKIVAKLAYENGGGYVTLGLPGALSASDGLVHIAYLFKDDVEALNTLNNPQQLTTGGIYSQTGVNVVAFEVGTKKIDTAEIASDLQISGGYLGLFDGVLPVEHSFFVWPEPIKTVYSATSTVTPTGTTTTGSLVVTAVSSVSGVFPGMTISGSGIPAGATIIYVGTTTVTMSVAATGNNSAETLTIQSNIEAVPVGGAAGAGAYYYQATYEWTDNQGLAYRSAPSIPSPITTTGSGSTGVVTISVPTLRLTSKIQTPVKIVIYRWSEHTQVYNQVTSIAAPVLNDTTVDQVTFVDTLPDTKVVGNNIIYTTGGVVENINAPSTTIMTIFDTRLWQVDAENPNTLWVSKQVVQGAPVDMSDLFTIYVAPNAGTINSTGPITALAPMDDKLVIFKKNAIFYINGVGPNNLGSTAVGCSLGNYSQPIFVTAVVGCTNQQSIVLTPDGLMFQSDKGIWLLGRNLQTTYIGAPVENFNGSLVNSAKVIPETNYVLFTLSTGEMLMYDYYFKQWGTFVGASAISSCIYNDLHTILTPFGTILQETPGAYLDNSNPVLLAFVSSWINLASLQGYERFYDFYILAKYLSPHFLLCQVSYDYNPSILHQTIIRPKNFSPAAPSSFGVPTPFGSPGYLEQWKVDAKQQLCQSFQLSMTEVFDPSLGAVAGAGFTMSGITCNVQIKKSTRPIRGANSSGLT